MPQIQSSKRERYPIPAGEHLLTLIEVRPYEQDNPYFKKDEPESNTNQKRRTRLIWQFQSDTQDADGNCYEYAEWTGQFYGDSRANLTAFLDQILPDADDEVKSNINTDFLIGSRYKAKIRMVKNQKGDFVPKAVDFEPIKDETKPVFDPDDEAPNEYPPARGEMPA